MKSFEIQSVETGADRGFTAETGPTIQNWTRVTVRIDEGFNWALDYKSLMSKLKAATELNDE